MLIKNIICKYLKKFVILLNEKTREQEKWSKFDKLGDKMLD